MKLLRYGPKGQEKPGLLDGEGRLRDLSGLIADIDPASLAPAVLDRLRHIDPNTLPAIAGEPRIGPSLTGIPKIVCVGLNYTDHARETGAEIPKEPILFMKATTSVIGPNDEVMLPKSARKGDWEVELAIVIGTTARYVSVHEALRHVAGYCLVNDVSEREFQIERGGQWVKGKSADTFCPLGPWLVTADELPDPQKIELSCEVNGHRMQQGTTANMIFPVAHLVSYISHFMTLQPGDVIPTGTPAGVGLGRKPPVFLAPGDEMHLRGAGLGEQRQRVISFLE